jgi:hypothetical protein
MAGVLLLSIDRPNRATLKCGLVRLAFYFTLLIGHRYQEETIVSLVKIIVITLLLLLSILFFWRFLF